ncbi:MAG: hypothetical protein J3K34DRAFT_434305 [Monoraphidium minutum]|nr:MAG: hypothetical protein J3K34DRAFT_434305 [Monoraphidium minutum]
MALISAFSLFPSFSLSCSSSPAIFSSSLSTSSPLTRGDTVSCTCSCTPSLTGSCSLGNTPSWRGSIVDQLALAQQGPVGGVLVASCL